jgi:replicative DNA helicase
MTDPPHDIPAEQAALGAVLTSAAAQETVRQALSPTDFYRPFHQVLFATITGMIRAGEPVDPVTVKAKLDAAGERYNPVYLVDLIQAVPTAANAGYYATIVRDKAVRRRLIEAGHRIVQIASTEDSEHTALTERAVREVEHVRDSGLGDGLTAQPVSEFMATGDEEYNWVIPQLLERGDRLILTGTSGIGKSTLFRQIAVCAAAGIHPFTHHPMNPVRVFLLDAENGSPHIRRKLRPLLISATGMQRPVYDTNLWIESRVDGIDLSLDKDLSWLMRQINAIKPDIFALGPLYRLVPRALNDDDDAAPVIKTLNLIRSKGITVLLEAHHGRGGDMAPRGSSALQNFPEFGLGLRFSQDPAAQMVRTADLVHWRGDRDERQWPRALQAGGSWPWTAYTPMPAAGNGWPT